MWGRQLSCASSRAVHENPALGHAETPPRGPTPNFILPVSPNCHPLKMAWLTTLFLGLI